MKNICLQVTMNVIKDKTQDLGWDQNLDREKVKQLVECCKIIDRAAAVNRAETVKATSVGKSRDVDITLVSPIWVVEDQERFVYELFENTDALRFKNQRNGDLKVTFTFQNIWAE